MRVGCGLELGHLPRFVLAGGARVVRAGVVVRSFLLLPGGV